jgi:hypothetical protein
MTESNIATEAHLSIGARTTAASAVGSSDVRLMVRSNRAFADPLSAATDEGTSAEPLIHRAAEVLVCLARWGADVVPAHGHGGPQK